jgi:tetraacyldisaccharide 4'-kinase
MQRWLESIWYGAGSGWYLRPFSALYSLAQRARASAYGRSTGRSIHPGRPVIVVGNLTVGGTGKTPLVLWLALALSERGRHVGIVSRGYGRSGREVRIVTTNTSWHDVGDEPLLLARRTSARVAVASDRVAAARELISHGADVIVSDDGLQHLRLARDCEIVVIDGKRRFGNGRLLPSGPLREPIERLANVDAIVVNGAHQPPPAWLSPRRVPVLAMRLVPDGVTALDSSAALEPLHAYRGRTVHAVAGIGNPQQFFDMLRDAGLNAMEHAFPDHHPFAASDLEFGDTLPVLMTEKDAVKCAGFRNQRLRCVRVSAAFDERDAHRLIELVMQRMELT